MGDLQAIIDALMRLFSIRLTVFGFSISFLSIFVGTALASIAFYAIFKYFD